MTPPDPAKMEEMHAVLEAMQQAARNAQDALNNTDRFGNPWYVLSEYVAKVPPAQMLALVACVHELISARNYIYFRDPDPAFLARVDAVILGVKV